jgi:hypothetical protein
VAVLPVLTIVAPPAGVWVTFAIIRSRLKIMGRQINISFASVGEHPQGCVAIVSSFSVAGPGFDHDHWAHCHPA